MDAAAGRQQAVAAIRARVGPVAGKWLSSAECLQIAIAANSHRPADVLGVLFSKTVASRALPHASKLAISNEEWLALFGAHAQPTRQGDVDDVLATPSVSGVVTRLGSALRCTLQESAQSALWQSPWRRLACFASLHLASDAELLVSGTLNGLVRSDLRRLEDLYDTCSNDGGGGGESDTLLVAQAITALADTAT